MTNALYLDDSYLNEFEAKVERIVELDGKKYAILDQTAFYPSSGGQPCDQGKLMVVIYNPKSPHLNDPSYDPTAFWSVHSVIKKDGLILHEIDGPDELKEGMEVHGFIDWARRYTLMRAHTSAHVVSGLIHKEIGAKITGNQIELDKIRIDFELENFDKDTFIKYIDMCNQVIEKDYPITVYSVPREEAEKDPSLAKLSIGLPPGLKEIRIVDIVGFDKQADGGTHVKSLKEVGRLEFIRCDNKGKNNRRIYYKLIA